eukprot:2905782-Pleurochrysis_carterae.AAC.2
MAASPCIGVRCTTLAVDRVYTPIAAGQRHGMRARAGFEGALCKCSHTTSLAPPAPMPMSMPDLVSIGWPISAPISITSSPILLSLPRTTAVADRSSEPRAVSSYCKMGSGSSMPRFSGSSDSSGTHLSTVKKWIRRGSSTDATP